MRQKEEVIVIEKELTADQIKNISMGMAEGYRNKIEKENELRAITKEKKTEIAAIDSFIKSCADKIMSGKETVEKDCDVRYDWDNNRKIWTDKESNEVLRETEIPEQDMQEDLTTQEGGDESEQDCQEEYPAEEETYHGE